jgi:hypothetical protein
VKGINRVSVPELDSLAVVVKEHAPASEPLGEDVADIDETAPTTEVAAVDEVKSTALYNPSVASILERLDEPEVIKDETATGMYQRVAQQLRDDAAYVRTCKDEIEKPRAFEAAQIACEGAKQVIDGLEASKESEARAAAREALVSAYCTLKELLARRAEREQQEEERQQQEELARKRAEAAARAEEERVAIKAAESRRRWVITALLGFFGVVAVALGLSWHFLGPAFNVSDLSSDELGSNTVVESGQLVDSVEGPVVVGVVGARWQKLTTHERKREVNLLMETVTEERQRQVYEVVLRNQNGEMVARWVRGHELKVSD